jgi:PHD/YefM family antitoxin component YafN of YafNO toxin-antitoxin module
MPNIRPISDLRNNANDISEFCHIQREPVFITKNGVGDMVVMSIETYERQQSLLTLYTKLAESEAEIANGDGGEDFSEVARKLRNSVHGKI